MDMYVASRYRVGSHLDISLDLSGFRFQVQIWQSYDVEGMILVFDDVIIEFNHGFTAQQILRNKRRLFAADVNNILSYR